MGAAPSVTTAVSTRFADLDRYGHVNNVSFLVYMETGRVRWLDVHREALGGVLVARTECDHLREIGPEVRVVEVTVFAERVGRTSFALRHDLRVGDIQVASGLVTMVKVDADHRPAPIDDAARALLLGG